MKKRAMQVLTHLHSPNQFAWIGGKHGYTIIPPMRAALYARVSTNNGQQDPEMQLRELREYASRRG
jgi:hypothetical protein